MRVTRTPRRRPFPTPPACRPYRKNVQHIILVRPSGFLKAVLAFMRPFVSRKAVRKIKQVWRLLTRERKGGHQPCWASQRGTASSPCRAISTA